MPHLLARCLKASVAAPHAPGTRVKVPDVPGVGMKAPRAVQMMRRGVRDELAACQPKRDPCGA